MWLLTDTAMSVAKDESTVKSLYPLVHIRGSSFLFFFFLRII